MEDVICNVSHTYLISKHFLLGSISRFGGATLPEHRSRGRKLHGWGVGAATWMKVTVHGPEPLLWVTTGSALMKRGY